LPSSQELQVRHDTLLALVRPTYAQEAGSSGAGVRKGNGVHRADDPGTHWRGDSFQACTFLTKR
jgi:hypothetical protein